MRRILFPLIFALVLSPIGVMAHAYQHFDRAEGDPFNTKQEADVPCGLCAGLVTLEHAASGPQAIPWSVGRAVPPAPDGSQGIVVQPFFHFFQRAPPAIL